MINMKACRTQISKFLPPEVSMLDVGGRSLPGGSDRSYRVAWHDIASEYFTADIADGIGVSHVMPGPYELPFEDDRFDIVVSGQTLEHVPNPFKLVTEMKRVLKPQGWMIIIVPSEGRDHDEFDYWRFKEHAFDAICDECSMISHLDWIDTSAPDSRSSHWKDHVFVGRKP